MSKKVWFSVAVFLFWFVGTGTGPRPQLFVPVPTDWVPTTGQVVG